MKTQLTYEHLEQNIKYLEKKYYDINMLEEIQSKHEFMDNISKDYITLINRDYVYETANNAYCKAHGKSRKEIIGKTIADIWGQKTFDTVIKKYIDSCFTGQKVCYEEWFKFNGIGKRCYKVSYFPYFNNKMQKITHVSVVIHDNTDWKRIEADLINNKKGASSSTIYDFMEFYNFIYHDTGRNQIRWFVNIRNYEKFVFDFIINDILELSKIESGKFEIDKKPFSYVEMLKKLPTAIRTLADKKQIRVIVNIAPDIWWLNGDETYIKQAVFNLLSNAIKFTDTGNQIGINAWALDENVIIEVWDQGIGIDSDCIPKIFNSYEDDQVKGIGLPVSKKIIELHGGTITLRSNPGKGSCFTITLPGRVKMIKTEDMNNLLLSNYGKSDFEILLVGDHLVNMELIKSIFDSISMSFNVDYMVSFENNIEKMLFAKKYDLILLTLMDITFKEIDGLKAKKNLDVFFKLNTPIIVLTSLEIIGAQKNFFKEACYDYILKPIDRIKVRDIINQAVSICISNKICQTSSIDNSEYWY